jgi:hypothetical protein
MDGPRPFSHSSSTSPPQQQPVEFASNIHHQSTRSNVTFQFGSQRGRSNDGETPAEYIFSPGVRSTTASHESDDSRNSEPRIPDSLSRGKDDHKDYGEEDDPLILGDQTDFIFPPLRDYFCPLYPLNQYDGPNYFQIIEIPTLIT